MGEIADMMLDGTMCQVCGVYMHEYEAAPGYPVTCASCDEGPGAPEGVPSNWVKDPKTVLCREHPKCERRFRTQEAATQHWVDKHG